MNEMPFFPEYPPDLIPGRNIKTGCYGLFLIGLDQYVKLVDRSILLRALNCIEDVSDCVVFNVLSLHYPPDAVEYDDIMGLARCFIVLGSRASNVHVDNLSPDVLLSIERVVVDILGLRDAIVPLKDVLDEYFEGGVP